MVFKKGHKVSGEIRKKISLANKGRVAWNKGKPHLIETIKKISEANKGRLPWNTGLTKYTDKRLMSSGMKIKNNAKINSNFGTKGKITSKETRIKISEANKGKTISEETRKKIGEANKGKIRTEEMKNKMRGKQAWNKGTKGIMKCNSGCWKKGHIAWNKNKEIDLNKYQNWGMKGKHQNAENFKGENNGMYGKHHTKKMKEKQAQSRKKRIERLGYLFSPEQIKMFQENMRILGKSRKGCKLSKEHKEKISRRFKEWRKYQVFPFKDTMIEIKVQNFLKQLGIEFFTHQYMKEIKYAYQCDILIPIQKGIIQKTIIECDGDYFHRNLDKHPINYYPKNIQIQRILDFERNAQLEEAGWRVIRLWENEINNMNIDNIKKGVIKIGI